METDDRNPRIDIYLAAWPKSGHQSTSYHDYLENLKAAIPVQIGDAVLNMNAIRVSFHELSLQEDFLDNNIVHEAAEVELLRKQESINIIQTYEIVSFPFLVIRKEDGTVSHRRGLEVEAAHESLLDVDISAEFQTAMDSFNNFDIVGAVDMFSRVLQEDPFHKAALFNLASIFHMLECPSLSIHYIERLIVVRIKERSLGAGSQAQKEDDNTSHSFLWALTNHEYGRRAGTDAYRRLATEFNDVRAAHKLATLTGEGPSTVAVDPAYVETIYDDMASVFENKLVNSLQYRGPWILLEMLEEHVSCSRHEALSWRILDMGCGSGLVGRVFGKVTGSPSSDALVALTIVGDIEELQSDMESLLSFTSSFTVGIDVSEAIAAVCAKNGSYERVYVGDLRKLLTAARHIYQQNLQMPKFSLVVAADTFIYIGILGSVFSHVASILSCGGLFAFSVEDLACSPFVPSDRYNCDPPASVDWSEDGEIIGAIPGWGGMLLTSARFAHSDLYIRLLTEHYSFECVSRRSLLLRLEGTVEVNGLFYLLQRK